MSVMATELLLCPVNGCLYLLSDMTGTVNESSAKLWNPYCRCFPCVMMHIISGRYAAAMLSAAGMRPLYK